LQVHIRAAQIIRRQTGRRIGIDTNHFRIPLLLVFAASVLLPDRFYKVCDLTFPGSPGKLFLKFI
jgi:hypothetical protein